MAKQQIKINDFDLFAEVVKSAAKIVDSAKFSIRQTGLEIYGARHKIARCELTSNAVVSDVPVEFSIEKLGMLLRILQSVKDAHNGDFSGLSFSFDSPFVRFESKKFKTKFATCNESLIEGWISKRIEAIMTPSFEFTCTSDMIKRVNGHSFMFADPKDVRVYVETKDDMENNAVFATLGNRETELNNEITLKLGLVNSGSLTEYGEDGLVKDERKIILDLERLNLFNAVQSDAIRIALMKECTALMCKTKLCGKNGAFFNLNVLCSVMKS